MHRRAVAGLTSFAAILAACTAPDPAPRRVEGARVDSSIFLEVAVGPDFGRDPAAVLSTLEDWLSREGVVLRDSRYRASRVVRIELLLDWVWGEPNGSFGAEAIAVVSEVWPVPRPRLTHEEAPARVARVGVGEELEWSLPRGMQPTEQCRTREAADLLVVRRLAARIGESVLLQHFSEWVPRPLSPQAMVCIRRFDSALASLLEQDPGLQGLLAEPSHVRSPLDHPSYALLEPAQRAAIDRLNGRNSYDTLMEERPLLHYLDPWQFIRADGERAAYHRSQRLEGEPRRARPGRRVGHSLHVLRRNPSLPERELDEGQAALTPCSNHVRHSCARLGLVSRLRKTPRARLMRRPTHLSQVLTRGRRKRWIENAMNAIAKQPKADATPWGTSTKG